MPRASSSRKPAKTLKKSADLPNGAGKKSQISTTPKLNSADSGDADEDNTKKLTATASTKGRARGKKIAEELSVKPMITTAAVIGKGRKRKVEASIENGNTSRELEEAGEVEAKISKTKGGGKRAGRKSEPKKTAAPEKPSKVKTGRGKAKADADIEVKEPNEAAETIESETQSAKANARGGSGRRKNKDLPVNIDTNYSSAKESAIVAINENEKAVPPKKRLYGKKSKVETGPMNTPDVEEPEEETVSSSPPKKSKAEKTPRKPIVEKITKSKNKKTELKKEIPTIVSPGGRGKKRNIKAAGVYEEKIGDLSNAENEGNAETKEITVRKKRGVGKVGKSTAKRGAKKTKDELEENVPMQDQVKKISPRGQKRQAAAEADKVDGVKASKSKKTAPLNNIDTEYNKADFELAPAEGSGDNDAVPYNLKISSWNVAGLRSWLKKGGLTFLDYEEPDIFCLQETKCTTDQLPEEAERIPGYHPYWLCQPGGYAGVAIYSKIMPIHVDYGIGNEEFDNVGRLITAEYEKFFLVCTYVPNSGRKLVNLESRMRWEKLFQAYVQQLDARKPVIICGDMNVSHEEIDLANPKTNTRNAGFTKEEREKMTELLSLGFVDSFRHLYPSRTGAYTFWTYMGGARARNIGWRLDYFLVSQRFLKRVVESCIRPQVKGSDHCPITLFLTL